MKLGKYILIYFFVTWNYAFANPLIGVKEIGILIEELDKNAIACNLSSSYIDASLRIPLSNSKIKIVDIEKIPDTYIYVRLTVIDDKDFCIASVVTSFNKWIVSEKSYGEFWRRSEVISFRKIVFQKTVGDILDSHAKQFIGSWLKENQR
jgi:hypothetical protein